MWLLKGSQVGADYEGWECGPTSLQSGCRQLLVSHQSDVSQEQGRRGYGDQTPHWSAKDDPVVWTAVTDSFIVSYNMIAMNKIFFYFLFLKCFVVIKHLSVCVGQDEVWGWVYSAGLAVDDLRGGAPGASSKHLCQARQDCGGSHWKMERKGNAAFTAVPDLLWSQL